MEYGYNYFVQAKEDDSGRRNRKAWVYFFHAVSVGLVKIGFTEGKPEVRLQACQTGSPVRLLLLGTIPGTRQDELDLHDRFAEYREHGEWFRLEGDLMRFVEDEVNVNSLSYRLDYTPPDPESNSRYGRYRLVLIHPKRPYRPGT